MVCTGQVRALSTLSEKGTQPRKDRGAGSGFGINRSVLPSQLERVEKIDATNPGMCSQYSSH
jgi:hypothetical protein